MGLVIYQNTIISIHNMRWCLKEGNNHFPIKAFEHNHFQNQCRSYFILLVIIVFSFLSISFIIWLIISIWAKYNFSSKKKKVYITAKTIKYRLSDSILSSIKLFTQISVYTQRKSQEQLENDGKSKWIPQPEREETQNYRQWL